MMLACTVKRLVKDTPKEDKPPNKGQADNTFAYTLYKKITSEKKTKDEIADSKEVPLYSLVLKFRAQCSYG